MKDFCPVFPFLDGIKKKHVEVKKFIGLVRLDRVFYFITKETRKVPALFLNMTFRFQMQINAFDVCAETHTHMHKATRLAYKPPLFKNK